MISKTCAYCGTDFTITDAELLMYEKVSVVIPEICVQCRFKQHMAFWPFGKFRKATSDLSGTSLITMLPANSRYPIYTYTEWLSDAWDPMEYSQEYDEHRSFFDQMKDLQEKVPRPHQQGVRSVGCDWCDDVEDSKNCYLSRSLFKTENLMYGYRAVDTKDSIDISHVYTLDNCYDCTFSFNSYNLAFSRNCRDCLDSRFLFDCRNCKDCFMCWNLRGKQYCIENVQYTKEEYLEEMQKIDFGSYAFLQMLREKYNTILRTEVVHRENFNQSTQSSIGTYMTNCNNCINVFGWENSENCFNCLRGLKTKDSIDLIGNWIVELSGNNSCCTESYALKYSSWSSGRYSEYLDECMEVENCFGCVGLRKKQYCILNKQYSKDEFFKLRESIVANMIKAGEYGKFLPYSMGLCAYNFTTASIYMPDVTREYIEKLGGYWDDSKEDQAQGMESQHLPDHIHDAPDSLPAQALICPETGWRFNIAEDELAFLKRKGFALPRFHFDVRTKNRMKTMAPFVSEKYHCCYCEKEVFAYYPKEWQYGKVACSECYLKEIA
mgnify:FL=1